MTLGEIYDFQVGDEFHEYKTLHAPAHYFYTTIVTGKFYNPGMDTLVYIRQHHDCYWSPIGFPVGDVYIYYNFTDTVRFAVSYLNQDISTLWPVYDPAEFTVYDTLTTDTTGCNADIIGLETHFDGKIKRLVWGKGLGQLQDYFEYSSSALPTHRRMVYYKKVQGVECGTAIPIGTAEEAPPLATVFPNPFDHEIRIVIPGRNPASFTLTDQSGRVVASGTVQPGEQMVDLGHLVPGFYMLRLITPSGEHIKKLIKR